MILDCVYNNTSAEEINVKTAMFLIRKPSTQRSDRVEPRQFVTLWSAVSGLIVIGSQRSNKAKEAIFKSRVHESLGSYIDLRRGRRRYQDRFDANIISLIIPLFYVLVVSVLQGCLALHQKTYISEK